MRVALVSFFRDPADRPPRELLAAWRQIPAIAVAIRRAGAEVTVVLAAAQDHVADAEGVTYRFTRVRSAGRYTPWRLIRAVRMAAPDVIHVQGLTFPVQTRLLRWTAGAIPVVAQDHGNRPPRGWRVPIYRFGFRALRGVMFTAREQAAPFVAAGVLAADLPVFEVLEGSTDFRPGDQAEARRRTGIAGDPCLVWLGRLDANKDPVTILRAFAAVVAGLPGARLWLCYRAAPLRSEVERAIAEDDRLRGRVHLLGPKPHAEVEWLLRAADGFVQGSHREGSGFALIEALACGTPPIVTDIPSFRRITDGGRVGALVAPGDVDGFARAIRALAGGDRAMARRAARDHFERALTFDAIGEALYAVYTTVCAR